jgi:hypothetical protein
VTDLLLLLTLLLLVNTHLLLPLFSWVLWHCCC